MSEYCCVGKMYALEDWAKLKKPGVNGLRYKRNVVTGVCSIRRGVQYEYPEDGYVYSLLEWGRLEQIEGDSDVYTRDPITGVCHLVKDAPMDVTVTQQWEDARYKHLEVGTAEKSCADLCKKPFEDAPPVTVTDAVDPLSYNVGESDYAQHPIQPWHIWLEYKLNPWDADIVKRVLRTKAGNSRKLDYQKIIHCCQERIRQLDL